jgi:aminocarboxymuconate-semialdehyde decarboxylase
MAESCARYPRQLRMLASVPLQDPAGAARELERAMRDLGAVGAVIAANVEGRNLGELPLDEFWAAAVALAAPVFIHPVQPEPVPRTARFGFAPVVQYTLDTTLAVGTLIAAGVLDRFPALDLILSHGGGTIPYLIGRFDCMYGRTDRPATQYVAAREPSTYLRRFHYDTILHSPAVLRFLAQTVDFDRLVLGTDDPFPPADRDPLKSLDAAGFSAAQIATITEENPRRLFRLS